MSLGDKGFHFCSKGSGYYDSFIFQNNISRECNFTALGIMRKYICEYEVLFWPFMSCVSDQNLQNGSLLVSNWNCFKRVSLIGNFDRTKWTWTTKLSSVNLGSKRLKWDLLRVFETSMSLPGEYWSSKSYFWRCRNNFWIPGGQEIIDLLKIDFKDLWSLIMINLRSHEWCQKKRFSLFSSRRLFIYSTQAYDGEW